MRETVLLLLATIGLALAGPDPAAAQRIRSPYRFVDNKRDLGAYVAYIFADGGEIGLGANAGPSAGLQFAMRVSDPIQISINVAYFPTDRDVIDPRAENPPQSVGTEPFNLVMLSGRLQFNLTGARSWHRLAPYVIGGLGIAIDVTGDINCITEPDRPTCQIALRDRFDFGTSFLGQFGIGTAVILSDRLGARFTIEDNIWKLKTPAGYFDPNIEIRPFPPDTDWTNNFQVTALLSYWF